MALRALALKVVEETLSLPPGMSGTVISIERSFPSVTLSSELFLSAGGTACPCGSSDAVTSTFDLAGLQAGLCLFQSWRTSDAEVR